MGMGDNMHRCLEVRLALENGDGVSGSVRGFSFDMWEVCREEGLTRMDCPATYISSACSFSRGRRVLDGTERRYTSIKD